MVLLVSGSGCVVDDRRRPYDNGSYVGSSGGYSPTCPPASPSIAQTEIQTGIGLSATPGTGAATNLEYLGNGAWHIFVTCDTLIYGYACAFDVTARTVDGSPIQAITTDGDDPAGPLGGDTAALRSSTTTEIDGMHFVTAPGTSVRVTSLLDGCADYGSMLLIGRGVPGDPTPVYSAPTDPLELLPTAP
jgi:hypothetical protein